MSEYSTYKSDYGTYMSDYGTYMIEYGTYMAPGRASGRGGRARACTAGPGAAAEAPPHSAGGCVSNSS